MQLAVVRRVTKMSVCFMFALLAAQGTAAGVRLQSSTLPLASACSWLHQACGQSLLRTASNRH